MATIYNTLKQFTNLGLIREIVVDKNKSLYDTNNRPHYHLYIEDEGKIHDIPTDNINIDATIVSQGIISFKKNSTGILRGKKVKCHCISDSIFKLKQ